jgi:hypothetical protein
MTNDNAPPKTQRELAAAFGVTPASVSGWLAQGAPREADGSFDLEKIKAWRAANLRPRAGTADVARRALSPSDAERLREAVVQHIQAKAELARLEVERTRASLIPREELRARDAARLAHLEHTFKPLPARWSKYLEGMSSAQREALLRKLVRETLETLAAN